MAHSRKKGSFASFLIPALMGLFLFVVLKYQDTKFFQSAMDFLFNPDAALALPPFWQKNRMGLTGCLILILVVYYRPTWQRYRKLIGLYRNNSKRKKKPDLPVVQASYLYRQDKALCLVTWLMDLCTRGLLILDYKKGNNPWSLGRGSHHSRTAFEQQLIDTLLQHGEPIRLQAILSEPDPDVQEAATELYEDIKEKNGSAFMARQSSLPALFTLMGCIAEIPFYMASQGGEKPGTLIITIFSAALFGFPAYIISHELPVFFGDSKIIAYIKLAAATLFVIFGHWLLFSDWATHSYWSTALFPDMLVMIAVMVRKIPLLPKNTILLSQLIGYAKHLSADDYSIREEDLPWSLGLGVHADINAHNFHYDSNVPPQWLLNGSQDDVQTVIKLLHQTFAQQVGEAVYGKMNTKSPLSNRDNMWRY